MAYRILYRLEAQSELDALLTRISEAAGQAVANASVEGIMHLIDG
jgi:hypothetical protein